MTLTGRIEKLYFGVKSILLAPLVVWTYLYCDQRLINQFTLMLLVYVLINMLLIWFSVKKWIRGSGIYLPLTSIDVLFFFFSMVYYGTAAEHMYIMFYFLIGLLSVFRPAANVALAAIAFSVTYVTAALIIPEPHLIKDIALRTFYIWLTGALGYLISRFVRSSEKKLLKTLDVLNERTWELESSQAMLENMYETTRALAAILDIHELLKEVLNVAKETLRVRKCRILLVDQSNKSLAIYAELAEKKNTIFNPPRAVSERIPGDITTHMAATYSERLIIGQDKSTRVLELPLISHAKVLGLLQIEPPDNQSYPDKERKNFTILANAAAVAIDNALLHMKMQELTVIDELTGLYNFRYFGNKLSDEIRRADRYHQPLSILMVDVDHFKQINDTQGHQTGNIILQEIVSLIKRSVRDVDIVARYGGEEFVVLLPQTEMKNATIIAERMRRTIEKSYFTNSQGQRDIRATVSIGVAIYPDENISSEQLMEKVDKAMYYSKREGRNRVTKASDLSGNATKVAHE